MAVHHRVDQRIGQVDDKKMAGKKTGRRIAPFHFSVNHLFVMLSSLCAVLPTPHSF
jgi:hypothetical protein